MDLNLRFFLERFLKRLLGKNVVEDALGRLDRLTQEEAKLATAEMLNITRSMDSSMKVLINGAQSRYLSG